jgi:hypothetical protein
VYANFGKQALASVVSQKFVDKVGRSPWTAADALVGLHRSTEEPDQGVRRGRWRPPHCNLFGELLTQETSDVPGEVFASAWARNHRVDLADSRAFPPPILR